MKRFLATLREFWKYLDSHHEVSEEDFERKVRRAGSHVAAQVPLTR